jgi:hypothetical protein
MSVTAHRTGRTERGATGVPLQRTASADPVLAPPRRVREGERIGPPNRRAAVGVPRVVARGECPPRQRMSFLTLLGVGAAMCLTVVGLGTLAGAGDGSDSVPTRTEVVRVQPGESLSELAARMAPGSDPGAVVERIRELNGDLVDGVRPGQPLHVPSAG